MAQSTSNLVSTPQKGLISFGSQPTNTNPSNNGTSINLGGLGSGLSNFFGNSSGVFGGSGNNGYTTQPFANPNISTGANAISLNSNLTNSPIASGLVTLNNGAPNTSSNNINKTPNNPGLISPTNSVGANTYSGGVNANGQTFPGYVSTLANTASQPSQNFTQNNNTSEQAQNGLINSIPGNSAAVQSATQNLNQLQNNYADQTGIIGNSPIGLSEQGGEQGLLNNQYSSKLGAAQTAVSNALANNAQTQTAYNEAGGLANTAAGNATSQQGTQQSGQAAAAGLAQPQTASPYGVYQPATDSYSQYGGTNGSGAAGAGGVQTQVQQGASVQQMTGQQAQAQALAQNLNSIITSAGINPASPGNAGPMTAYVNGANQWLQNNTGDPQYQNFANLISEISSRYASILNQSGGTPTDQSMLSHTIINSLASGQSIQQVLQSLDKNATDSINALKGASQTNANGSTNNTNSQYSW